MLDQNYEEIDPSPLASQTLKFFAELQAKEKPSYWETFCELNSSAPECKTYDV